MDGQDASGTEKISAWPALSADLSHAREAARVAAADHVRASDDYVVHELTQKLAAVTARLAQLESEVANPPEAADPVEVEALSDEVRASSQAHARQTNDLAATVDRLTADVMQSDRRVDSVESSLLATRDENNKLIEYLESIFARLAELEGRLSEVASANDVDELARHIDERLGAVVDWSDQIDERLTSVASAEEVAELVDRASKVDERVADVGEVALRAGEKVAADLVQLGEKVRASLSDVADRHRRSDERMAQVDSRLDQTDRKLAAKAGSSDLDTVRNSIDELIEEHLLTRDLATNATSLSMALTDRVEDHRADAAKRLAEEVATLRNDLELAIASSREAQRADDERLADLIAARPTTNDLLVVSEEVDVRLAELAPLASLRELSATIEARLNQLAPSANVRELAKLLAELVTEHDSTRELATTATSLSVALDTRIDDQVQKSGYELTAQVGAVRAELQETLRSSEARYAAEIKKLEIRLSTLPRTEDVVALSGRLDETELLAGVRVAKQLAELRDELESAMAAVSMEYEAEAQLLETRLASLPTADDVTTISERVDARLAVVPTAQDVAALAGRVDSRIDSVSEQSEEAHVLAEKAKDRAEFASDGVAEIHNELEDELEQLRARLSEVALAAEDTRKDGQDGTDAGLAKLEEFRTDLRTITGREVGRQSERIAELEAALERQARRIADLDTEGRPNPRRWQRWLTEPVRIPDTPLAALPPAETDDDHRNQ